MGQKYTKVQTRKKLDEAVQEMDSFYALGIVNWKGKTPLYDETQEYYSEIISEYFLKKQESGKSLADILGAKIKERTRTKSYDSPETNCKTAQQATDKRGEEKIAKQFYESCKNSKKTYGDIGIFIKHQMPLKDYRTEEKIRAGKVDLVSYNENTDKVYLLEFKRPDNTESLLRAGLEAFTYSRQLNKEKFCDNFKDRLSKFLTKVPTYDKNHPEHGTKFVPTILVYKGGAQYKNYKEENRPQTLEFLKKLGVECFFIDEKNNIYDATKE